MPDGLLALLQTLALFLVGLLFAGSAWAEGQVRTEMTLDPERVVGLDEMTVLEIKILVEADGVPSIPDPVFELENFREVEGPSQSTGLTTVNGRRLASRTLIWKLRPWRTGRARVYSARVTIEGQVVDIGERRVEVVRNPPPGRGRTADAGQDPFDRLHSFDPFNNPSAPGTVPRPRRRFQGGGVPRIVLRAETVPARPYVGQQTIYTLSLYTQVDINSVNPEEFPGFKGFWARVIPQPDQKPEMVRFDGESFGRVILLQRALFPRRAGDFEIHPVSARMVAQMPETGPYGSLAPKSREIVRQSNAVRIQVRELPSAPDGFQGAVGTVELVAELVPRELEVGGAATLTLRLHGRAHLQGVQAPPLPEVDGLRVFPPQQQSDEGLRGQHVYSSRTWSFVLVPDRPGEWHLPAIEVPFFDPKRKRYEVTASAPLDLIVQPSSRLYSGGQVELHPIRDTTLPIAEAPWRPSRLTPWFFALPWMISASVLAWRHRAERGGAHSARSELLVRLDRTAAEERPRRAAAKIEEVWREFLHERWGIPRSSPSTQWGDLLTQRGFDGQKASELVQLADDLHYLRYAPKLSSITELREELLERSRKLARSVG